MYVGYLNLPKRLSMTTYRTGYGYPSNTMYSNTICINTVLQPSYNTPLHPPTTDLVLETKGELRSTPYNAILESLLRDQEDNPDLHAIVQSGDIVQIVKRSDGNLSFHVAVTTDVEALRQHRVTLHGSTYAFRSRAGINQRFFLDVINFTVLNDAECNGVSLLHNIVTYKKCQ